MKFFLTLDIGTTSIKTCIFDEMLNLRSHVIGEYQLVTHRPSYIEFVPEYYWKAVLSGSRTAVQRAKIDPHDIIAISVTTQGETMIPVDKNGHALYNALVWLDERASKEAEFLAKRFDAASFYARTGLPELTGFCPVAKMLWFKLNEPEVYKRTYKFLLLEDYILMRLTGLFVTEKALACSTGWFDLTKDGLWYDILDYADLDAEKLPELLESGVVLPRRIRQDICTELGLSTDVKVVTCAMDQTAGAVGAGNIAPGMITETTGTALCIGATMDDLNLSHKEHVTVYRHITPGKFLMMPICMTAGMLLKWFKDEFCVGEVLQAEKQGRSVYNLIDEIVATVTPGANGLIVIPYLTGTIQPDNNPRARGVFFGAGLDTKRAHFLRAIFESIAFMLRENIELIESVTGVSVFEIRSLGGGSRSEIWRQIKADITGRPIVSLVESECTSLGAAILAATALGLYPDVETAVAAANAVRDIKTPDPSFHDTYEAAYAKYLAVYDRLKDLY